jgi:hypothetical protein
MLLQSEELGGPAHTEKEALVRDDGGQGLKGKMREAWERNNKGDCFTRFLPEVDWPGSQTDDRLNKAMLDTLL